MLAMDHEQKAMIIKHSEVSKVRKVVWAKLTTCIDYSTAFLKHGYLVSYLIMKYFQTMRYIIFSYHKDRDSHGGGLKICNFISYQKFNVILT